MKKTYEDAARGTLIELLEWAEAKEQIKGEITIVISGATAAAVEYSEVELAALVAAKIESGLSKRDAIDAGSVETGSARKQVYAAANVASSPRH